MKSPI
jgi:predicted DNA binding protein